LYFLVAEQSCDYATGLLYFLASAVKVNTNADVYQPKQAEKVPLDCRAAFLGSHH
jgi:hypothetical protein